VRTGRAQGSRHLLNGGHASLLAQVEIAWQGQATNDRQDHDDHDQLDQGEATRALQQVHPRFIGTPEPVWMNWRPPSMLFGRQNRRFRERMHT